MRKNIIGGDEFSLCYYDVYSKDEAVYFAKENGKNQIIFKNEIQKIKNEKMLQM